MRTGLAVVLTVLTVSGLAAQSVPADYVRSFFGAVHVDAERMRFAGPAGATWSRLGVQWPRHEPERDVYTFEDYDRTVAAARRHGVRLLPVLAQTPEWASGAPAGAAMRHRYPAAESELDEWREYVATVVDRYPDVEYWEIWNEPNIDWFLRADANHREYVDRILIPAAEVIHAHGRKVVAPSYTLEWPLDVWPLKERPARHSYNVASAIRDVDRWLAYHDAWRHIDILSVHYSKGDTEKPMLPFGENMMPFYDHVHERWIATGRLDGIWNTEEGLTAEEAGNAGFVALEPWEKEPYAQWVARYFVPVLHWAIGHDWTAPDRYKVFWYHMKHGPSGKGALTPTNLLERVGEEVRLSETGRAMGTLARLLTEGRSRVGLYDGPVEVGLGLFPTDTAAANYFAPYRFRSYAFRLDDDVLVAAWLDLPGIELVDPTVSTIEAAVHGLAQTEDLRVSVVHYVDGTEMPVTDLAWAADGTLRIFVPRIADPVLYLKVEGAAR